MNVRSAFSKIKLIPPGRELWLGQYFKFLLWSNWRKNIEEEEEELFKVSYFEYVFESITQIKVS